MTKKRNPEYISSGERLAATRTHLYPTLTQWQFAEQWGVNRTTYNNWEIGKAPIPKDFIDRFRRSHPKFGYGWFWHSEVPDDPAFRTHLAEKGLISFKA
jgi:DNA-binding XRE family transcriptional regulator